MANYNGFIGCDILLYVCSNLRLMGSQDNHFKLFSQKLFPSDHLDLATRFFIYG
jgi:hypothetical protein